jgi:hypothetical protein
VESLYNLHRERVRSVDKLIGKWDGTGQGQVKGRRKAFQPPYWLIPHYEKGLVP